MRARKPILISAISAVILAGLLLFYPTYSLTPRQRLAKRCVVRFWELHGQGWEVREVDSLIEANSEEGEYPDFEGMIFTDGALVKDGQPSPFYLTVKLSDLPNGDCACDTSGAELSNDHSLVWEPKRITLSRD